MKTPDYELRRLTDAWHDGTITPEDGLRLEQRLAAEKEARDYFFEITAIESSLATAAAALTDQRVRPAPRPLGEWGKMAAMFLFGLLSGALALKSSSLWKASPAAGEPPSAMVTGMLGVTWADPPGARSATHSAGPERYGIASGLIELTFASGTRALIEGPAEFLVEGDNAMRLDLGKLVADVPKGAEGFSVTYPDGKIIDIGTEFGIEVDGNGRAASIGVFRGEIEVHPRHQPDRTILLQENHAISALDGNTVSVPFIRDRFTRKFPSREFAWTINGAPSTPTVLEFDVSHLIWKPGEYRAICKWMGGNDALVIEAVELTLNGELMDRDAHPGFTGAGSSTRDNSYDLVVAPETYRRGRWTLRIHGRTDHADARHADASGVVLFEEGLSHHADAADFVGTWEYLHDGRSYRRTFHSDGSASLEIDGAPYSLFATSRWRVSDGRLELEVEAGAGKWWREIHILRDSRTLVFVNRPYRNAVKVSQ